MGFKKNNPGCRCCGGCPGCTGSTCPSYIAEIDYGRPFCAQIDGTYELLPLAGSGGCCFYHIFEIEMQSESGGVLGDPVRTYEIGLFYWYPASGRSPRFAITWFNADLNPNARMMMMYGDQAGVTECNIPDGVTFAAGDFQAPSDIAEMNMCIDLVYPSLDWSFISQVCTNVGSPNTVVVTCGS